MNKPLRLLVTGVVAALGATTAIALGASPAAADNDGSVTGGIDSSGPYVAASDIRTSGHVDRGALPALRVPATCWWEPVEREDLAGGRYDPSDPKSMQDFFRWAEQANAGGSFSGANLGLPGADNIEDAIDRAKAGERVTWYEAKCRDGVNALDEGFIEYGGDWAGTPIGIGFQAFADGEVPEPVVAAEVLADAAKRILRIDDPEVHRNPEIPTGAGAATLVNWPTWFWFGNVPTALGQPIGVRTARVQVGDAFAEVTGTGQNVTVSAPAAVLAPGRGGGGARSSVTCTLQEVTRAYGAGATDANACSVRFTRASVGQGAGWPVTVTSNWHLEWEGQEADGTPAGADLGPDTRSTTVNLPVAESQAVVNGG